MLQIRCDLDFGEKPLDAEHGAELRLQNFERNLAIVPRSAYAATALAEGDRIEIVHFIGGG